MEFMIHAALGPVVAEIDQKEVDGAVLPVTISTLEYSFQGNPDSWQDFIAQLADDLERNQIIVGRAIKSSQVTGTAILTGTVEHAEHLHYMITSQESEALLLHGQLPKRIRAERMAVAVIFASPVSAAVDKATPAATRLIQSIGRARRPFPGKRRAFVLGIIDTHPFGKASFKKRSLIYKQQGFDVRILSPNS
jgi:hypothetical protein